MAFSKTASLYYHTIRHSKPGQLFGRLWFARPRYFTRVSNHPALRETAPCTSFIPSRTVTEDFTRFRFLNEELDLDRVGWDDPCIPLLWRYRLHYFEYLNQFSGPSSCALDGKRSLIQRWIRENPFGKGTAFMPYPMSLRIVNWVKFHWNTGGLGSEELLSLWNQSRFLSDRPEHHVYGNHLFSNAKALLFAGAFFDGLEAESMFRQGLEIVLAQLDEQFLADGAHFELSPMYHALAMEDLLDLLNITRSFIAYFPRDRVEEKIRKGLAWLSRMTHANGELSNFNDTANGVAPGLGLLEDYAGRVGIPIVKAKDDLLFHHKESGFVVVRDDKVHIVMDVGKPGCDYIMAHAHADTLSFELSVMGRRLVVNSGISRYGVSRQRLVERGTSSHSTVEVDGQDSSEVWMGFRMARRARPFGLDIRFSDEGRGCLISCSHDGYRRLRGSPVHRRTWVYKPMEFLLVRDEVTGSCDKAVSRLYLHPDMETKTAGSGIEIHHSGIRLATVLSGRVDGPPVTVTIEETHFHRGFGDSVPNRCITVDWDGRGVLETKLLFG